MQALAELPDRDLLLGGTQASAVGTTTASAPSRGKASGWVSIGAIHGGGASRLAMFGRGGVFAAGTFTTANGAVFFYFAPAAPTCQPVLQVVGVELGAVGMVRLTSTNALEATIGVR